MPKRFTATEKWSDPWFRGLSPSAKLLWLWLLDNCDLAGIIEPDLELARFQIGATEDLQRAFEELASRIEPVGKKYLIPRFLSFQYGETLNPVNTAHRGVIRRLESAGLEDVLSRFIGIEVGENSKGALKDLSRTFEGPKDKDKDKDKEKDKDKTAKRRTAIQCPDDVDQQTFADWQAVRTAKRAGPVTQTVLRSMTSEAAKAGITLQRAIEIAAARGWQAFKADWAWQDKSDEQPVSRYDYLTKD